MIQEYDKYKEEDHEVWSILYSRIMEILPLYASQAFLDGLKLVGFESDKIPNFDESNNKLSTLTGWKIYAVPGLIDNKPFFEHLSNKEFPATTWLRQKSQLDYLQEPDMFHDVFGHIPLLSNAPFVKYLEELARITLKYIDNDWIIEIVSRLYWYTVEFGLIRENGNLKVYGAGILSSSGETQYSIDSHIPKRHDFNIQKIFDTPYIKDKYQEQYFGQLVEISPTKVILDHSNIGFEVQISLQTYDQIKTLKECKLYTYLHIKKEGQNFSGYELYGFSDIQEKSIFELLISVSGIGSNTARIILSSMTYSDLKNSIVYEDEKSISSVKGIGPKTAKRLILELKDKVMKLDTGDMSEINTSNHNNSHNNLKNEALNALMSLGFNRNTILKALEVIDKKSIEPLSLEDYIKNALKML
ncbi:unnamed protein product [Cyprideis torosa]|uniref:phenylalanine 4-monooxygenase n=1 Tax=Cyprideis torosa TaxID=163714 RepID=A0A7R8WPL0_9CRUS|nr:unnamed protein product [Cyprideis torosa]CAG0907021.1 unnamed protein product [Cyprideis torosa]